jgi:hypothetical protein
LLQPIHKCFKHKYESPPFVYFKQRFSQTYRSSTRCSWTASSQKIHANTSSASKLHEGYNEVVATGSLKVLCNVKGADTIGVLSLLTYFELKMFGITSLPSSWNSEPNPRNSQQNAALF